MFVFEMFEPPLIMYLRRAPARPMFMSLRACNSLGSYFFFPFGNESRWRESVSIPPLPPHCSPVPWPNPPSGCESRAGRG